MISAFAIILISLGSGVAFERPNERISGSGIECMADVKVSTANQLKDALLTAKAGDKIILAPGNYGAISISAKNFSSQVTLVSSDPAKKAHIDSLLIKGSNNIKIQGIDLGRSLGAGESAAFAMATVSKSSNITFEGVVVHGSADKDPSNDGRGISVLDSSRIKVLNSNFFDLGRGVLFGRSTDIEVIGNKLSNLRSDGMDFSAVQRVLIDNNRISDIYPATGDHPDAIQFFTAGATSASTDIVIRNNQIFQGNGGGAQGIFLRNGDGLLPFERVKIQNNIVYAYQGFNGITVIGGKNIEVVGNTSISQTNDKHNYWFRLENIVGGSFQNNVGDSLINVKNSGLVISGNKLISEDPTLARRILGINDYAAASAERLSIAGFGFQPSLLTGDQVLPAAPVINTPTASPFVPELEALTPLASAPIAPVSATGLNEPASVLQTASGLVATAPVVAVAQSAPTDPSPFSGDFGQYPNAASAVSSTALSATVGSKSKPTLTDTNVETAASTTPIPVFTPAAFAESQSAPLMSLNYAGVESFLPKALGTSASVLTPATKSNTSAFSSAGAIQFASRSNVLGNFATFNF